MADAPRTLSDVFPRAHNPSIPIDLMRPHEVPDTTTGAHVRRALNAVKPRSTNAGNLVDTVSWSHYCNVRGLHGIDRDDLGDIRYMKLFDGSRDGRFFSVLVAGAVREVDMMMGVSTTGIRYEGEDLYQHTLFAALTLPQEVSLLMPRSTFLRRDAPAVSALELEGDTVRIDLESAYLDAAYNLKVAEWSERNMWWELFDPITIDGLASCYPIQWVQHNRSIVFVAATTVDPRTGVNQVELDTLCAGGSWMALRFLAAAAGDNPYGGSSPAILDSGTDGLHDTRAVSRPFTSSARSLRERIERQPDAPEAEAS